MCLRLLRFGTVITTDKDFSNAEFTDLTCNTLAVSVRNPDDKGGKCILKNTPTNPKYAAQIMEYVRGHIDDPKYVKVWDDVWTLAHKQDHSDE